MIEKNEELPGLVREKLLKLGIEGVVFDLDDFLIEIRSVFHQKMDEFVDVVCAVLPDVDPALIWKKLEKYNNAMYRVMSVNPMRWLEVMRLMSEDLGIGVDFLQKFGGPIFRSIYTTKPVFREGAEELLGVIRETELPFAILTHANLAWTNKKYEWLGLGRFLNRDRVSVVDENKFKGSEDWRRAGEVLGVGMGRILIGGDNLIGDIRAGLEAGAGLAFWLALDNGWVMYNDGKVPKEAVVIKNQKEFVNRLLMLA